MSRDDARTLRAGRHTVEIKRPGKVLFPGGEGAKADAVDQTRTDPWAGLPARGRSLGPARRRLAAMCS
jgi:hypothetical protein